MISLYTQNRCYRHALLFGVPNGELRDPAVAGMLAGISQEQRKMLPEADQLMLAGQGVLPGAPDLVLCFRSGVTLIEVKRPDTPTQAKGVLSYFQRRIARFCIDTGIDYRIIDGLAPWWKLLNEKGIPLISTCPWDARPA